ncbi:unnamed protein product, partial [Musa hybrid cultivar]
RDYAPINPVPHLLGPTGSASDSERVLLVLVWISWSGVKWGRSDEGAWLYILFGLGYLNWFSGGGGGRIPIPIPWLQPRMGFVGRNGTRFVDIRDGSPVYVNGWNSYWLMSSDSGDRLVEMLRRGRSMGMSVCRTWAFSDGGANALQIFPRPLRRADLPGT